MALKEALTLKTLVSILNQQTQELVNDVNSFQNQVFEVVSLNNRSNDIETFDDEIKAYMASMNIDMVAIDSQKVIVQQYIDRISELLS